MRHLTTLKALVLLLLFFNIGERLYANSLEDNPSVPTIDVDGSRFEDRIATLNCETEGAQIWYSFSKTSKGRKYSAPITLVQTVNLYTWSTVEDLSSDTLSVVIYAGEDPLCPPTIDLTKVNGKSRIVSLSSPDAGVGFLYSIGNDTLIYDAPFSINDTTSVVACTRYEDAFTGEVSLSDYSEQLIPAGTFVKLNPVVFSTNIYNLAQGETSVKMSSDVSDILLQPEVSIVYTDFNAMKMESVPNDTTIIVHNTRLTAFATSDGYLNSDTSYIDIQLKSLETVTRPYVKFQEAKSNGDRVFYVENTADGYPVPLVYYYTEGKTQAKAVSGNTVTIPRSEYGWVHFYAAAEGYDPSPKVDYYVDSRTSYTEPYEAVTLNSDFMPASAGDLEFWNAPELHFDNYPSQPIRTSGYTYFHLKVHENFNNLVLPFPWDKEDNLAFDSEGNLLTLGEDFWLYRVSTIISSDNIANGTLDATHLNANAAYLIKVKPSLVGKDIVFRSTPGYTFQVLQTDFSDIIARTDFIIRPNKRFQKVNVEYVVYELNDEGTAFEKHQGATIEPFTTILIAPFTFAQENESIDLIYSPKFTYNPANGSSQPSIDHVDITLKTYPKMSLRNNTTLYVKSGSSVAASASFERLSENSYRLNFSKTIDTDGSYTINLPEGLFEVYRTVSDTEPFALSKEETLTYNVLSSFTATSNPPDKSRVDQLQDITVTFNKNITASGNKEVYLYYNGTCKYQFSSNQVTINGNKLQIHLPQPQTDGGTYQLEIPAGFLLINNSIEQSTTFVFNYYIQVAEGTKFFDRDTIIWINENTMPDLYYQGWIRSDAGYEFEKASFNIKHHNPVDDSESYGYLDAIKISDTPQTMINMYIAGVDSITYYLANSAGWTYYTNFTGETTGRSFSYGATVSPKSSEAFGIRLDKTKDWSIKVWGNSYANYLYAVKIFTEMPPAGIEQIKIDDVEDSIVYDLSGKIVKQMIPGRVYIKNGKKIIY